MKTRKMMLPMAALVAAAGISFATPENDVAQERDYIRPNGQWKAIEEVNCTGTGHFCSVQLGEGGPVYEVYDQMSLNSIKESDTPDPTVIEP